MDVLANLGEHIEELKATIDSGAVFGPEWLGFSQYTVWLIVDFILVLALVFYAKKKLAMVPNNGVSNSMEFFVEFTRDNVAEGVIGPGYKKHFGLLLTMFFFILISNMVGLIPGAKPSTGTMGATWALSLVVFIYFNYYGIKKVGFFHYFGNLAPKGVPAALVPLVWIIELASLFLRFLTLAVRLFANMYAGHMVLGTFAVLTQLFVTPMLVAFSGGALLTAMPAIAWMLFLFAMYAMEFLVACIQAYVFTLLTAVYISLAVSGH